jgi:hypothetical protein
MCNKKIAVPILKFRGNMKRVRIKPIWYVGLILFSLGIFGWRLFNIQNVFIFCGLVALGVVGLWFMIKGKEKYDSVD